MSMFLFDLIKKVIKITLSKEGSVLCKKLVSFFRL